MRKRDKKDGSRLLASELEILQILWDSGPGSIIEIQRLLPRAPQYTTVQTRLNRLVEKGLAARTDLRPAKYSAAITQAEVTASDLDTLLEKVNRGSVVPLVAQLVDRTDLSDDEIAELKRLVNKLDKTATDKKRRRKQC